MTQQTTPRKSGEMVARDAARNYDPRTDSLDLLILQAISDAVIGSGAVEALELVDLCFKRSALSNRQHGMCIIGDDEFEAWTAAKKAYDSLRALTLPEQPNK